MILPVDAIYAAYRHPSTITQRRQFSDERKGGRKWDQEADYSAAVIGSDNLMLRCQTVQLFTPN
jgi:hypothetical protein